MHSKNYENFPIFQHHPIFSHLTYRTLAHPQSKRDDHNQPSSPSNVTAQNVSSCLSLTCRVLAHGLGASPNHAVERDGSVVLQQRTVRYRGGQAGVRSMGRDQPQSSRASDRSGSGGKCHFRPCFPIRLVPFNNQHRRDRLTSVSKRRQQQHDRTTNIAPSMQQQPRRKNICAKKRKVSLIVQVAVAPQQYTVSAGKQQIAHQKQTTNRTCTL